MNLNQKYFDILFSKKDLVSEKIIIKDDGNDSQVIPFSITSSKDEEKFNLYSYSNLKEDKSLLKDVDLKILKMQAGLGSSVKRDDLVDGKLSAKGVDLSLKLFDQFVPIAKGQLLIFDKLKSKNIYQTINFQNLVNEETKVDIENLCRDFETLESIEQLKMPTIDETGELTTKRQAPCGHGFIGLYEIIDSLNSTSNEIVCIGNGEDINSTIDTKIASLVVSREIPILMITTDKTSVDLKGGQLALVKNETQYLTIIEKAQAQSSNQLDYFEKLGLRENDKKALFNTNVAVINKQALRKVVNKYIQDFDMDSFLNSISPNVIKNIKEQDNEKFTQLESALGSVLLNTDKYFREQFGISILSVLNLEAEYRDDFFLPIKKREDYDFIKDNYIFDEDELKLKKL